MKNWLKLNHTTRTIIMDKTFAKFAENTMSAEYAHLQSVRRDYPTYTVKRREIKKNVKQEHYHGLTYAYMEDYIAQSEVVYPSDDVLANGTSYHYLPDTVTRLIESLFMQVRNS